MSLDIRRDTKVSALLCAPYLILDPPGDAANWNGDAGEPAIVVR